MTKIDYKNYRAPSNCTASNIMIAIGLAALIVIIAWMGERDHQARLEQIERKSAMVCK